MDNTNTPKHPVWYEPHPVTPERKAEIRAQGFVILDEIFRPDGYENPASPALLAANPDANGDGKVTAADLKAALTAKGIAFKANASKADLQALLDAAG